MLQCRRHLASIYSCTAVESVRPYSGARTLPGLKTFPAYAAEACKEELTARGAPKSGQLKVILQRRLRAHIIAEHCGGEARAAK